MRLRPVLLAALASLLPAVARAQPHKLGEFQSWTAATHVEGGQKVCYAFARAAKSEGVPGRQNVLLTITHRPKQRDAVVAAVGFSFAPNAEAKMAVGSTELAFYTAGSSAAARDSAAAIRAFRNGRDAVLKAPGPGGRGTATDSFPLEGFSAAYDAISRECPAARR